MASNGSRLFPVADPTTSFWLTQPSDLADFKSHPQPPEQVDVAIIGSGLTGVSAAYHILKRHKTGPKPRIAIFEARSACSGATGRNGGHAKGSPSSLKSVQAKWGDSVAVSFGQLSRAQRIALRNIAEEEGIECDLYMTRSYDVFLDAAQAAEMKQWFYANRAKASLLRDCLEDMQYLEGPNIERITGVRGAKGAISLPVVSLWPYKFVTGLLQRVLAMGGEFYANTPVSDVSCLPNGGEDASNVVHFGPTPSQSSNTTSTTRASHVIFATNGYTASLLPEFAHAITPVRGTASHLTVSEDRRHPSSGPPFLTHTYNPQYPSGARDYLVPRPDGGIILGGGQETYKHDLSQWWNNVDDAHVIDEVRDHFDRRMQTLFHGWEHSGAHVHLLWTGVMGYTADAMPHVGAVPGKSRQWIAAGYNGGGMSAILSCTEALVKLMTDEVPHWADLGLPAPFEPTASRLRPSRT